MLEEDVESDEAEDGEEMERDGGEEEMEGGDEADEAAGRDLVEFVRCSFDSSGGVTASAGFGGLRRCTCLGYSVKIVLEL